MWPFKRKPESPEEKAALERLDEATQEVSDEELEKEPPGMLGAMVGPRVGEPAPGSESGLRDALRKGEQDYEEKHPGENA
jgi:hypothetical protein